MRFAIAIRTRADGEWFSSPHFANMEIRGGFTSSITSVAKDNLVMEIYDNGNNNTEKTGDK